MLEVEPTAQRRRGATENVQNVTETEKVCKQHIEN